MQAQPSESELVQAAADSATMARAQQLLQEEKDEVKHMHALMRYAKCAAQREQQITVRMCAAAAGMPGALLPAYQQHAHGTTSHAVAAAAAAAGCRTSAQQRSLYSRSSSTWT
jgi:hypothetical protein